MFKRRSKLWLQGNRKSEWKTREEQQRRAHQLFLEKYLLVLMAVLPGILLDLDKIPDPRPKKIKHRVTVVLFYGIVIFALGFDSR